MKTKSITNLLFISITLAILLFLQAGGLSQNLVKPTWADESRQIATSADSASNSPAIRIVRDPSKPIRITVLYFNDLHGHLKPFTVDKDGVKSEVGGIARMASLIDEIRYENEANDIKTFVLFAGDLLQGTPMSTVFNGWPDIECFNDIGVSAVTVGNHEFDFGIRNFFTLKGLADFPFISSNVIWKRSKETIVDPYVTFPISDDLALTVIGVTTEDLLTSTKSSNVELVDVLEPVQKVVEIYNNVKDKGPVIVLSHSKHQVDRDIAIAIPDLAAIIGGHDQILLDPFRKVGNVPIFQAFEKGKYLGRIDYAIDPQTKESAIENWTYIPITAQTKENPKIADLVAYYDAQLDLKFKEVIGEAKVFLDGERERIRYEETTLGNLVADIMREYSGAQIALLNAGSLRASVKMGPITVEDVFKMMPYDNQVVIVKVTGDELLSILTRSVSGAKEDEDGGFLHVSGVRFVIRGKKVENVLIGDQNEPVIPDMIYSIAINDFMATGGDGYDIFKGKENQYTGLPLRELIIDAIRDKYSITSKIDGRVTRV